MRPFFIDQKKLPAVETVQGWHRATGYSALTIRKYCLAGELPFQSVGPFRLITRSDFIRWAEGGGHAKA